MINISEELKSRITIEDVIARYWEEWSGWCHRIARPPQSWQYVGEIEE